MYLGQSRAEKLFQEMSECGESLTQEEMNEIIRDNKTCSQHNISVTLDRETLMVKLQSGSNTEAFVYQIFENPGEEEDGIRINSVSRSTRFQKGSYLE